MLQNYNFSIFCQLKCEIRTIPWIHKYEFHKPQLSSYAIPEVILPQITSLLIDAHKEHQRHIQEEIGRIQPLVEDLAPVLTILQRKNSNQGYLVVRFLAICCKLSSLWNDGDFIRRQKVQNLVFPSKIYYDGKNREVRTFECNHTIFITRLITDNYKRKYKEKEEKPCDFSSLVAGAGLLAALVILRMGLLKD